MNKRFYILILILIISFVTCPMAKNIYSDPDLSNTTRKFEAFTIDFRGIDTPNSTYWSLCNWQMDLTEFKKTHTDATGGGAYGGLQTVINGKTAILSFWEVGYKENGVTKTQRASRIYPKGDESTFGGEGEGTNYIHEFDWPTNVWHRFVIFSWTDNLTKKTFVGEWIQNLSTQIWTLFAYFNTKLDNSYITGGLSQFQENFNANYFGYERSFQIKNMYVYDRTNRKWISLNTTKLSYDPASWGYNTAGTHDIGYTTNYFYGSSGLPVEDQKAYDASIPSSITGSIKQPDTPSFAKPSFKSTSATLTSTKMTINWSIDSKSCPCYEYEITVQLKVTSGNKNIHTYITSRPEESSYIYSSTFKGTYLITIKAKSISKVEISSTLTETI
jgi:hypothetical protein